MKNTSLQFDPVNFGLRKWNPIAQEIDIPSDVIQWNSQKLVIQMVSSDAKFDSYQNQTEHFGELRFNRSHRLHESAEDTLFWRSKSLRRIDIDKTIQQYRTHPQTSVRSTKESDFIDRLCTEERNCLLKCTLLFNILSRQFFFFPHWSFKLFRISKLLCKWLKACSERSQRSGDAISNKPFEGINSHIGRRLQYWYHLIKIPFLQGFWYKVKANVDIKQETKRVLIVCSGRVLNLWFLQRNVFSRSAGDKPNPPPRTTTV